MAENNSDHSGIRTNLLNFLPEVLSSETNKSIFETLFNRFFTKNDTKRVAGYIGSANGGTSLKRRIQENRTDAQQRAHRQAFQLQPLMYSKIGSTEHIQSWVDCLNELKVIGINTDKFSEWGRLLSFNWVPPVDLDKIVNYGNYYWYDSRGVNSTPQ